MLVPTDRSSIYDVLRPPVGCAFDMLAACTYSAALDTVLSLPAALVAGATGAMSSTAKFGATEFASLRRTCDRTVIFCQAGAIHPATMLPPAIVEVEPMVHEVTAPMGGAFHPKLWVIRFEDEKKRALLRLAVLSRNLTSDRSWDLGLVVDGRPTSAFKKNDVSDLLRALLTWTRRKPDAGRMNVIEKLAHDAEHARWQLPEGMKSLELKALGVGPGAIWAQPASDRLLVLSPFLTPKTVSTLAATSAQPLGIVSRPDALDRCWPAASAGFLRRLVLTPPAEACGANSANLHGKALIWERRGRILAAVGSMNATSPATQGRNVEFMATFDFTGAMEGADFDDLLGPEALGAVVQDYEPADLNAVPPEAFDDRQARDLLCRADLVLGCKRESDGWRVSLSSTRPLGPDLGRLLPKLCYRLATMSSTAAWAPCCADLSEGRPAPYPGVLDLTLVTGFVVFEADGPEGPITFCRNVEVAGVDQEERRTAAVRALLPDRARFDEFVRTMVGDPSGSGGGGEGDNGGGAGDLWGQGPRPGLLELLVRCSVDDPDRFMALRKAVEALGPERLSKIAPAGFLPLWEALAAAAR